MQSAETDELTNTTSSSPIVVSFPSSKQPSSKMTISTNSNKNENNNGGRGKKRNKYPSPIGPNEIPKPIDFTVDNIAISPARESTVPPKSYVVYNMNPNINSNPGFGSHMQIQNNTNNKKLKITSQNIQMTKPPEFNPGNIAIPPNFSNSAFPP